LTRSIQKLEEQVNASIFVRSNSHIVPTDFGRKFLRQAEKILIEVEVLEIQAAEEKGLLAGEIVIGTGTYPEEIFLADILAKIVEELPNVNVKILSGNYEDFIEGLFSKKIDLFIGEKSLLEKDRNLSCIPLTSEDHGNFFCRAGHPLLGRGRVRLKDIVQYPFVGVQLPTRVARKLPKSAIFGDRHGRALRPKIYCYSFSLQKKVVSISNAIGICVKSIIEPEIKQGKLGLLPLQLLEIKSDYGITYLKSRELSNVDQIIIKIILDVDKKGCKRDF
jgi:DNA-binding transcriptional LysR family regulator